MKITVRSSMHISKILAGRRIDIELGNTLTLGGLLKELAGIYGQEFNDAVCGEEGYSTDKVAILVNGTSAAAIGGVDICLNDGDEVTILPAIQGG